MQYGQWWAFVREQGDLADNETRCLEAHGEFLREIETTPMAKSFKMIVLEALLDNDGFRHSLRLSELAEQSRSVLRRRPALQTDLASNVRDLDSTPVDVWQRYWRKNPIKAWLGENLSSSARTWFRLDGDRFRTTFSIGAEESEPFEEMVRQIVDQRLAAYQLRSGARAR